MCVSLWVAMAFCCEPLAGLCLRHDGLCCCRRLQAAEQGDMATAQQLWSSLQAVGLKPSHCFMNGFLM